MEEFVTSDLMDSDYILSAAVLDDQGFIVSSVPADSKTKQQLAKFAEILFATERFEQTSIITEQKILIIHGLAKNYTLVVGCKTNSNLGAIRKNISNAVSRLDAYLDSTKN